MLLYVLPVVFAVGGIAFPVGVLFYWTTSNLWTMGQQFYVIRNNPAPGTPAFKAKVDRDKAKAARKGLPSTRAEPSRRSTEVEERRAPAPPRCSRSGRPRRSARRSRSSRPAATRQFPAAAPPMPQSRWQEIAHE